MDNHQLNKEIEFLAGEATDIISKHCDFFAGDFPDQVVVNVYDLKELIMLAKERVR